MGKIKLLDKNLISKIAAGEVIERPASVIKELLENSIDAKATSIIVSIKNGGLHEITINDNGEGISEDDIEAAFLQHATSKIASMDDLNDIYTFGFRGEALATIVSASEVILHTYNKDSQPILATISNGEIIDKKSKPRNTQGVTITVKDLFRHIPARKKFLSSEQTETRHIYNQFNNIALAHPEVEFKLIKEEKEVIHYPKSNLKQRIIDVIGKEYEEKLIEVNYNSPGIKIAGYIGTPDTAKEIQNKQFLFLNKRGINDKRIAAAIKDGFRNTVPPERKPLFVLFIDINPQLVDINVHPRKLEVRFSNPNEIYKSVKHAIANQLEKYLQIKIQNNFQVQINTPVKPFIYDVPRPTSKTESRSISPSIFNSISFTQKLLKPEVQEDISEHIEIDLSNVPTHHYSYIGQIFKTFLIFESGEEMIIIDQHAADERINHEKLEEQIKHNGLQSQDLLLPIEIDIDIENPQDLKTLGIDAETVNNKLILKSIPEVIGLEKATQFILALKEELNEDSDSEIPLEKVMNKVIATIACHTSIRAGDNINEYLAKDLINKLMECKLPYSCPHGRPIIWKINRLELQKNFLRT